jgi:DNA primase
MSSIDEIKSRVDILDLAAEAGVKLRRSGRSYSGFCPFHDNRHTPAFVIWPETGTWRCFGECNEGGDIFKFVMKRQGWDFREALEHLAQRAGVTLEERNPLAPQTKEQYEHLRTLLEEASLFYRHQLLQTDSGASALAYLRQKRQLTPETIETFGLGYAPNEWDALLKHFRSRGYAEEDLQEAGLLSVRDEAGQTRRVYDRFRHRIMIPIRDENGRMAGFGARLHPEDPNKDQAKFINTAETPLFHKGRILYGLDRARKPIRAADQVVIVEGYLDVIALHQAGFENVLSPMGTALTEEQLRLLKRFSRKIVLALDPDAAGQKAILRGLEAAREALDREEELRFDARGLLRHEARLQADLRVASLPDGLDPDEIVARNPEEWRSLMQNAKPIVEHVLDTLLTGKDLHDHRTKAEIVAQMLPLVEDLPNPVERDSYRQMLARRLKVDERSLIGKQATAAPAPRPRKSPAQPPAPAQKNAPAANPLFQLEQTCLAYLLRRPHLLPQIDRRLQESRLQPLSDADFEYTDHQVFLRLLQQAQEQDETDTPLFVQTRMGEALLPPYETLMRLPTPKRDPDDRLLDEITRMILQRRRLTLSEAVNHLRFMMQEAQESGDTRASAYQEMMKSYMLSLNYLDVARQKMSDYRRSENAPKTPKRH